MTGLKKYLLCSLLFIVPLLYSCGGSSGGDKANDSGNSLGTVSDPVFNPAGGTYSSAQLVSIQCKTEGAAIYYTTDGTDPTTSSDIFDANITVDASCTIKAFAVLENYTDSKIASATYTIMSSVDQPSFNPNGGTFSTAQTVSFSCGTTGATIYYTIDGTDPTISSEEYTAPIIIDSSCTIKAFAVYSGYTDSEIATAVFTIIGSVDQPVFSPEPGIFSDESIDVTINCATDGSVIYYTTDGTDPTTASSVYSSAITVTETTTIKAFAVASGKNNSSIASATYTFGAAAPVFSIDGGTYRSDQTLDITCSTSGSTIYYTIDGSDPSTSSTEYAGSISVNSGITIRAIASAPGKELSAIASESYVIEEEVTITSFEDATDISQSGATVTYPAGYSNNCAQGVKTVAAATDAFIRWRPAALQDLTSGGTFTVDSIRFWIKASIAGTVQVRIATTDGGSEKNYQGPTLNLTADWQEVTMKISDFEQIWASGTPLNLSLVKFIKFDFVDYALNDSIYVDELRKVRLK